MKTCVRGSRLPFPALMAAFALVCALSTTARAEEPRWSLGFGAGAQLPSGSFADHADPSAVYEIFVGWRPTDRSWGLRFSGLWAQYAHSDTSYDLPGIRLDTRTGSEVSMLLIGPSVSVGDGRLRLLAHAGVGGAWARTRTATRGQTSDVGRSNQDSGAFAFEGGVALWYRLLESGALAAELGARWLQTSELEYVPDGGIRRAAGTLQLATVRGEVGAPSTRAALVFSLPSRTR